MPLPAFDSRVDLPPPAGGDHTPQHGVGGRRTGVETRGESFPEITLDLCTGATNGGMQEDEGYHGA